MLVICPMFEKWHCKAENCSHKKWHEPKEGCSSDYCNIVERNAEHCSPITILDIMKKNVNDLCKTGLDSVKSYKLDHSTG